MVAGIGCINRDPNALGGLVWLQREASEADRTDSAKIGHALVLEAQASGDGHLLSAYQTLLAASKLAITDVTMSGVAVAHALTLETP